MSDIPDLAELSWEGLERLPISALTASVRRILRDADERTAPLVTFQSALDD